MILLNCSTDIMYHNNFSGKIIKSLLKKYFSDLKIHHVLLERYLVEKISNLLLQNIFNKIKIFL